MAQTFLNCVCCVCECCVCCGVVVCRCGVSVGWVCVQDFRGCVQDLLPPSVGPPSAGPPKISRFFSSPATIFIHSSLSLGVFSWNFGGVCWRGPSNVHVWALQTCAFQGPCASNTRRPQEREERKKIVAGEGKKSAKFWAPTLLGATLRGLVFAHPGGREGGGRIGLVEKNLYEIFLGLSRKKGPIGPSRIGLSRIGPSRACPNQSPLHFLMRLYRRLYTASQLMMPPHNYRSRSSFSGAPSPMTL